jgi:hypothetical protein
MLADPGMTANTLGLLGPLMLLAALGLNAILLWRKAPELARALAGTARPRLITAFAPDGESNVIPFPRASARGLSAARPAVRRAA